MIKIILHVVCRPHPQRCTLPIGFGGCRETIPRAIFHSYYYLRQKPSFLADSAPSVNQDLARTHSLVFCRKDASTLDSVISTYLRGIFLLF